MAFYNLTLLNTTEDVPSLVSNANDITGGLMLPVILLIVFTVALIILILKYDFVTGIRISGVITTFVAIGFWGAEMMDPKFVLIPALIVLLSFVFAPTLRTLSDE